MTGRGKKDPVGFVLGDIGFELDQAPIQFSRSFGDRFERNQERPFHRSA